MTRLRYVAEVNPSVPGLGRSAKGQEVSFLPLDHIWADDRFDPSDAVEFTGDVQSYNAVAEGDLVVPKVAPTFTHGRVAIATGLVNGLALATSEIFVVRPKDGTAGRFLKYRLIASDFRQEGEASWVGVAGLKRVSSDFLKDVRISQSAWRSRLEIAEFLDFECARIDDLCDEIARTADVAFEPTLASLATELEPWPRLRIGHRFDVQLGKMLDASRIDRGDTLPYLRNANVYWDRFDLSDINEMTFSTADRRLYRLRPGDLLVCEGRHVGRSAVWSGQISEMYFQKALHRVRAREGDSTRLLMWCLRLMHDRGDFYADGTGSTIPHLPAERLRAARIPLPPPAEQQAILSRIDERARVGRELEAHATAMRDVLAEYRDALITEAVTGQLDVSRLSDAQMQESLDAVRLGEHPEVLAS